MVIASPELIQPSLSPSVHLSPLAFSKKVWVLNHRINKRQKKTGGLEFLRKKASFKFNIVRLGPSQPELRQISSGPGQVKVRFRTKLKDLGLELIRS